MFNSLVRERLWRCAWCGEAVCHRGGVDRTVGMFGRTKNPARFLASFQEGENDLGGAR